MNAKAKEPPAWRRFLATAADNIVVRVLACVFVPLLVFGLLLLSRGKDPFTVYATMLNSVLGSGYGVGEVIVRATPLIMTSVTSVLPARVGLANAGGEGQLLCGALASAYIGSTLLYNAAPVYGIPLLFLFGALFGALWAGIAVFLKMKLNMNETLTTILMNYVMLYLSSAMIYGPMKDPAGFGYPQTAFIGEQLRLKMWFGTRANVGILIALALALLTWPLLQHTRAGFVMRTIGGNQNAAYCAGYRVKKVQVIVFLVAGAIAGLAGAILIAGVEGRVKVGTGVSMGFMGFLAAGIVKNNPVLAIFSALLIAMLNVMGNSMEINTGLPAASIQILITLFLLTMMVVGGRKKNG